MILVVSYLFAILFLLKNEVYFLYFYLVTFELLAVGSVTYGRDPVNPYHVHYHGLNSLLPKIK
jgi:hypothetical protein